MMKKFAFSLLIFICTIPLFGQEIEGSKLTIPAERLEEEISIPEIDRIELNVPTYGIGPLDPRSYPLPYSLTDIGFPRDENVSIDILAIGQAQERHKRSQRRSVEVTRQLQQIKSQVQVFQERDRDSWNRANDDLRFNSKMTPDGGIRNEAVRDIRQPFVNPYYDFYRRNYYSPYGGFYPYRR